MEMFVAPRRGGKTRRIVEWAAESPDRIVVTADNASADVVRAYLEEALDGMVSRGSPLIQGQHRDRARGQVVTARSLRTKPLGMRAQVAIDEVDAVLSELIRATPTLVTFTGPVAVVTAVPIPY